MMPDRVSPSDWAALFNLSWNPSDPEIPDYTSALAQNQPNPIHGFSIGNTDDGYQGHSIDSWTGLGMLMLQQRAVLYLRRKPGDCVGFQGARGLSGAQGFVSNLNPQNEIKAAINGGIVGASLAALQSFIALFSGADVQILDERNVLCPFSLQMTQVFQQFDAAVVGGKADANQSLGQLQNAVQMGIQFLAQKIGTQQSGGFNTGGCYQRWLAAHLTFRKLWYAKAVSGAGAGLGTVGLIGAGGLVAAKIAGVF